MAPLSFQDLHHRILALPILRHRLFRSLVPHSSLAKETGSFKALITDADFHPQVNVPKTRRTYCKGKDCKKHTQHKVTRT